MKQKMNKANLIAALMSASLTLPAVSTAAINTYGTHSESLTVNVSDLDLSQEKGIETLYQRLKTNAVKVCGIQETHITGSRIASSKIKRHHKKCTRDALGRVVDSIGDERLIRLHQEQSSI